MIYFVSLNNFSFSPSF